MAKNNNLTDFLTDVANAIREKKGTADLINPQDFSNEIASIKTNGDTTDGKYLCQIIDYDGTVLKQEYHNEGDRFTLLNEFPIHEKLIAQEYSSPVITENDLTSAKNSVIVENSDITIGVIYTTASGLSEFDITLTKVTGLTITLKMDGTKNWGDGSSNTNTSHTYTDYGDYTITCDGTTITASSSVSLMGTTPNYTLTAVRLSNKESVEQYAFTYCYSLTSITILEGVTSIGDYAFNYCQSLTSITIPNSVTSIGDYAIRFCGRLSSVSLGNNTTSIGAYAFYCCYSLTSITIPEGVTSIGANAFSSCVKFKSVYLRGSEIGSNVLASCVGLKAVDISNDVTTLNGSNFANCYNLTSVKLPSSLTNIPYGLFSNCHNLTSITIPDSVTSIGNSAFNYCTDLESIIIPEGVTSIGSSIQNCYNLTSVKFPSGLTNITSGAFISSCYKLLNIDFSNATAVPILGSTFSIMNHICKIIVPDSLYSDWIKATNWASAKNFIYKASEV